MLSNQLLKKIQVIELRYDKNFDYFLVFFNFIL